MVQTLYYSPLLLPLSLSHYRIRCQLTQQHSTVLKRYVAPFKNYWVSAGLSPVKRYSERAIRDNTSSIFIKPNSFFFFNSSLYFLIFFLYCFLIFFLCCLLLLNFSHRFLHQLRRSLLSLNCSFLPAHKRMD